MITYKLAVVPKFAEQRVITAINRIDDEVHLSYSSPMDTLVLLYFAEPSFLCRFRVESINVFVLPRFHFCTSNIFFVNKQFCTCANVSRMTFIVRSYEYWRVNIEFFPGWKKIKQRRISFVLGYLRMIFTKNFNCNISLWFFISKFRSYIGKHFFIKITACMPLSLNS